MIELILITNPRSFVTIIDMICKQRKYESVFTQNVNPVRENTPGCFYTSTLYAVNSSIYFAVAEHLPKWPYLIPLEAIREKKSMTFNSSKICSSANTFT